MCQINKQHLDGIPKTEIKKLLQYSPLPIKLTFKRQKLKCCDYRPKKKKQKNDKKDKISAKKKKSMKSILLYWIVRFMKLSWRIVSKTSSMLDAITDVILLYKAQNAGAIAFTMILFLTLLAPYILSYSSGVQIFVHRKTFQNVRLFTFKSLLLGLYLFPTGIIYFILLDIIDALMELYKWIAFGCIRKARNKNDLVQIESNTAEYFGMSRMDWFSFKKQKLIGQLLLSQCFIKIMEFSVS